MRIPLRIPWISTSSGGMANIHVKRGAGPPFSGTPPPRSLCAAGGPPAPGARPGVRGMPRRRSPESCGPAENQLTPLRPGGNGIDWFLRGQLERVDGVVAAALELLQDGPHAGVLPLLIELYPRPRH